MTLLGGDGVRCPKFHSVSFVKSGDCFQVCWRGCGYADQRFACLGVGEERTAAS